MADRLLEAINAEAWDSTKYVSWTFPGGHHYVWDRTTNDAQIKWNDYEVHLDMDEITGLAFRDGTELDGRKKSKAIAKAWEYWCNDSYWLAAPFKIRDPGTSRHIAVDEEGNEGLLVSYESGGVTPGDAYLWYVDDSGLPTGFKMWVKIIPVGGVYATWEGWKDATTGAKIASEHELSIGGVLIKLTDIKAGNNWSDLELESSPIRL